MSTGEGCGGNKVKRVIPGRYRRGVIKSWLPGNEGETGRWALKETIRNLS